jgi:hypothetical protein
MHFRRCERRSVVSYQLSVVSRQGSGVRDQRGDETAKVSVPPGCGAGADGDRSQVSSAAADGPLSAPLRAGTGAHGARLELVVLYAYTKRKNAGLRAYKRRD